MGIETQEKIEFEELRLLGEFIDHFNIHYKLLLRRYSRFKEINDINNLDIDVITYLDMIIVQLRAMCVENPNLNKNYTVQNLLRKVGEDSMANQIEAMLAKEFIPCSSDFTTKKAIKMLADKFICHYDNFDDDKKDDLAWAGIIEKRLRSPYDKPNLDSIMETIIHCVGDGLIINM